MFDSVFQGPVWDALYFGNTLREYAAAAILFAVLCVVFKLLQGVLLAKAERMAQRTQNTIDDVLVAAARSIRPQLFYFLALFIAASALQVNHIIQTGLQVLLIFLATYQVIAVCQTIAEYIIRKRIQGEGEKPIEDSAVRLVNFLIRGVLWVIGILFALDNVGVEVTSFIAGLGIGGIAIALAVQNILEDLFSSLAIYLDKPFEIGDFVVVGEHMGVVERIGIKTTRIRALQGEEIVISNKELTSVRIQNFKKMKDRRIVFEIGVAYDTPQEKLEEIPGIVRKAVEAQQQTRFDRSHFKEFGDSALLFENVYYLDSSDYNTYMDTHQSINLQINAEFAKRRIEIAYPTRTVYLKK
jgi:small-conductance mechanosensitive channel